MSIKSGRLSEPREVSFVKHDLRADKNVTLFSIKDYYKGLDGNQQAYFIQCTAWEDLPLQECQKSLGEKVRIMYLNQFDLFERNDKEGKPKMFYSMSVKAEVID